MYSCRLYACMCCYTAVIEYICNSNSNIRTIAYPFTHLGVDQRLNLLSYDQTYYFRVDLCVSQVSHSADAIFLFYHIRKSKNYLLPYYERWLTLVFDTYSNKCVSVVVPHVRYMYNCSTFITLVVTLGINGLVIVNVLLHLSVFVNARIAHENATVCDSGGVSPLLSYDIIVDVQPPSMFGNRNTMFTVYCTVYGVVDMPVDDTCNYLYNVNR